MQESVLGSIRQLERRRQREERHVELVQVSHGLLGLWVRVVHVVVEANELLLPKPDAIEAALNVGVVFVDHQKCHIIRAEDLVSRDTHTASMARTTTKASTGG